MSFFPWMTPEWLANPQAEIAERVTAEPEPLTEEEIAAQMIEDSVLPEWLRRWRVVK